MQRSGGTRERKSRIDVEGVRGGGSLSTHPCSTLLAYEKYTQSRRMMSGTRHTPLSRSSCDVALSVSSHRLLSRHSRRPRRRRLFVRFLLVFLFFCMH